MLTCARRALVRVTSRAKRYNLHSRNRGSRVHHNQVLTHAARAAAGTFGGRARRARRALVRASGRASAVNLARLEQRPAGQSFG